MRFSAHPHPDFGLHVMPTDKFKTNALVLDIQRPLVEGLVTRTALIPYVLTRGTARYPSVQSMQRALDGMYGSYMHADVFKLGERHVMQFRLELPNGKYLPGRPELLKEGIAFFHEVLTAPLLENDGFKASFVDLEKEALRKRVEGLFNNKMQYARVRAVEAMCADEPYRLFAGGRIEDLAAITPQTLLADFRELIATAPMDMYVVGDVDGEAVAEELGRAFRFAGRKVATLPETLLIRPDGRAVKQVVEHCDVNQGQLVLGWRAPVTYSDADYYTMMMYNGILGGFAHSKLFVNVREKESLAYSVRSRYDGHKGVVFVQAGINIPDHDKALGLIHEQLAAIARGEISDEELAQTRAMLINTYREAYDSPGALINLAYESQIAGCERTIEELAAAVPAIGRDEIVAVAQQLVLDTVYFLRDAEPTADPVGATTASAASIK